MSHLDGPSSSNIDEHLHSSRLALEQLTDKYAVDSLQACSTPVPPTVFVFFIQNRDLSKSITRPG